mmetsp:Transcript_46043/g.108014  ORF Transcript_46043/g.108014 Transcript_46043/m.108014 type:complete len:215 (-) Transcript_46043:844-1488(-)
MWVHPVAKLEGVSSPEIKDAIVVTVLRLALAERARRRRRHPLCTVVVDKLPNVVLQLQLLLLRSRRRLRNAVRLRVFLFLRRRRFHLILELQLPLCQQQHICPLWLDLVEVVPDEDDPPLTCRNLKHNRNLLIGHVIVLRSWRKLCGGHANNVHSNASQHLRAVQEYCAGSIILHVERTLRPHAVQRAGPRGSLHVAALSVEVAVAIVACQEAR